VNIAFLAAFLGGRVSCQNNKIDIYFLMDPAPKKSVQKFIYTLQYMPNISYIVQKQQGSPVAAFCTLLLPADLVAQPPARASHSYSHQAPGIALIGQIQKKRSVQGLVKLISVRISRTDQW
jgi:hypothetical protein